MKKKVMYKITGETAQKPVVHLPGLKVEEVVTLEPSSKKFTTTGGNDLRVEEAKHDNVDVIRFVTSEFTYRHLAYPKAKELAEFLLQLVKEKEEEEKSHLRTYMDECGKLWFEVADKAFIKDINRARAEKQYQIGVPARTESSLRAYYDVELTDDQGLRAFQERSGARDKWFEMDKDRFVTANNRVKAESYDSSMSRRAGRTFEDINSVYGPLDAIAE